MALYHCTWQWPTQFDKEQERSPEERLGEFRKVFKSAEEANPFGARMRAWYSFPGEWTGVLIVEAASHEELAQLLGPYSKLMHWEVKPAVLVDYQTARQQAGVSEAG